MRVRLTDTLLLGSALLLLLFILVAVLLRLSLAIPSISIAAGSERRQRWSWPLAPSCDAKTWASIPFPAVASIGNWNRKDPFLL